MKLNKEKIWANALLLKDRVVKLLRLDTAELREEQKSFSAFEKVLDGSRIIGYRARSEEADVFRFLRTQILQSMDKSGFKTLAITSPRYNDGKTTISANLSASIAQDLKQTVLLVDIDLRKPSLHTYLDIQPKIGLTDYLAGEASVQDCLVRMPFERFSVFPAGAAVDKSSETLGSHEMEKLAKELKERYTDRLVIYDMPPILEQDDPLVFLPHVDAVLLIVREGVTTTNEIKRCLNILADANVLGVVLNNAR